MSERGALLAAVAEIRDALMAEAAAEGLSLGARYRGPRGSAARPNRRLMILTRADAASGRVSGHVEVPLAALAERGFPYTRLAAMAQRGEAIGYILSDRHRHPSTFVLRPAHITYRAGRLEVLREDS